MSFFPYFVCALLGVDSLRGGLAEGNKIFPSPFGANVLCVFWTIFAPNNLWDCLFTRRRVNLSPPSDPPPRWVQTTHSPLLSF